MTRFSALAYTLAIFICPAWGLASQAPASLASQDVPDTPAPQTLPADRLDLSCWKLTIPIDADDNQKPDEVKQPDLATFSNERCFFLDPASDGVLFRAWAGGATTPNSKYPRCELREMTANGSANAAWATNDGTHTMTLRVQINQLPPVKPHVVCAQIHDADDDLMMVRLERKKLFIERNDIGDIALDDDYELGTAFDIKIEAADGVVRLWHNDQLKMTWEVVTHGCYFKAGCYTQSNPDRGDEPDAYGETVIHALAVEHRESQ